MSERLVDERRAKAEELRTLGTNPYANDFTVTALAADLHQQHQDDVLHREVLQHP